MSKSMPVAPDCTADERRLATIRAKFSDDEWATIEAWSPQESTPEADALFSRYMRLVIDAAWRAAGRGAVVVPLREPLTADDQNFLRAIEVADPETFRIFKGDWTGRYASHSEADFGLISRLHGLGADADRIQRIFRASALYREKTDERRPGGTYLTSAIAKVVNSRDAARDRR